MMSYKIAALGPIPSDVITTHTGLEPEKYGSVLYTTAVLSALMGESGEVIRVSHLRCADVEPVRSLLGTLPGDRTTDATHRLRLNQPDHAPRAAQPGGPPARPNLSTATEREGPRAPSARSIHVTKQAREEA